MFSTKHRAVSSEGGNKQKFSDVSADSGSDQTDNETCEESGLSHYSVKNKIGKGGNEKRHSMGNT